MRKPIIIALVGASGSGKTTLAKHLAAKGIPQLVSYTTRPMRDGETDGIEHWFVDESVMPPRESMLAYANFGGYHYWTSIHQAMLSAAPFMTYTIDEKALVEMDEKFRDRIRFIKVYIKRENLTDIEEDRRSRDNDRLTLPDKYYSIVIENNGTIEDFLKNGEILIKSLL